MVSVNSALLAPSLLPFYLAGHGWKVQAGLEDILAGSLCGTIASGLLLVLAGQPLPIIPFQSHLPNEAP